MLEKLAKSIEEINVLAEHYRTCHNVEIGRAHV